MPLHTPIPELFKAASCDDPSVAGPAFRQILDRHVECHQHMPELIELLRSPNAAISDYAFRTLELIGEPTVLPLIQTFHRSNGRFRQLVMGLIAGAAKFEVYFPILEAELERGEQSCRIWAANCLGRCYRADASWPPRATDLLNRAVEILFSTRHEPEFWLQARMTLKQLGKIPSDT